MLFERHIKNVFFFVCLAIQWLTSCSSRNFWYYLVQRYIKTDTIMVENCNAMIQLMPVLQTTTKSNSVLKPIQNFTFQQISVFCPCPKKKFVNDAFVLQFYVSNPQFPYSCTLHVHTTCRHLSRTRIERSLL